MLRHSVRNNLMTQLAANIKKSDDFKAMQFLYRMLKETLYHKYV